MTLLDEATNRSYKNAVFAVKRQSILNLDQAGIFVPLCTRNVFLVLQPLRRTRDVLEQEDRDGYQAVLSESLVRFSPAPRAVQHERRRAHHLQAIAAASPARPVPMIQRDYAQGHQAKQGCVKSSRALEASLRKPPNCPSTSISCTAVSKEMMRRSCRWTASSASRRCSYCIGTWRGSTIVGGFCRDVSGA